MFAVNIDVQLAEVDDRVNYITSLYGFGKFKVVRPKVNRVTYDMRNSNWHFILVANWYRTLARSGPAAISRWKWNDIDHNCHFELSILKMPFIKMPSHWRFSFVSTVGRCKRTRYLPTDMLLLLFWSNQTVSSILNSFCLKSFASLPNYFGI